MGKGSIGFPLHPKHLILFLDLFHQSIQESGASLTCFEDSLGPTYRMIEFARRTCNYDAVQWNSLNYTSLKNCLMNLDLTAGLQAQQVGFNKIMGT